MNNSPENKDYANSVPCYIPERKKNQYTLTHAFYAIFALLIGTLWYRWVLAYKTGGIFGNYTALPVTVFTVVFFAFAISYFRLRRIEIGKDAFILMCACLIFSLRYALYPADSYSFIALLSVIVLHICVLLFLYCVGSNDSLDRIVGSILKSVFYAPFSCFHCIFASFGAFLRLHKRTAETRTKTKDILYKVGFVLLGIIIALPITVNLMALLSSDGFFADFLGDLTSFFGKLRFDIHIGDYFNIISILVSMYIFGAMYSADRNKSQAAREKEHTSDSRVMPKIMGRTITVSILVVYLLFFIAQIDGFSHMATGSLPENTTYAEFARSGFFELCTVACISGGVMYLTEILELRDGSARSVPMTKVLMIVFNLLLIFTAAFKMIMYISAYGYTPKRFYTLWFMLLLTVLFVMAYFKLRNDAFRLSRYSVYVTLVWLAVLFLMDFEGISASLNAEYFQTAIQFGG